MLFNLNAVHNEWSELSLEEWISQAEDHCLVVVDQVTLSGETFITLQGTKEDFLSWAEEEGGPSLNEEELEEELIPA
jgi:hypothetical protein